MKDVPKQLVLDTISRVNNWEILYITYQFNLVIKIVLDLLTPPLKPQVYGSMLLQLRQAGSGVNVIQLLGSFFVSPIFFFQSLASVSQYKIFHVIVKLGYPGKLAWLNYDGGAVDLAMPQFIINFCPTLRRAINDI